MAAGSRVIQPPPFVRLLVSPIGALIVRVPQKPQRVRSILRQLGHGASLDAGRIPEAYVDWRVAFDRDTDSMRNERNMSCSFVSGREFRGGVTLDDEELAAIQQPTLMVYGDADPVGTVDVWRRALGLIPRGELYILNGGGHLPWLDDPAAVGSRVRQFLAA